MTVSLITQENIDTEIGDPDFVEVRVPASSANLGSGFDCCALALQLYLTVRAYKPSSRVPLSSVDLQGNQGFVDIGSSDQCSENLICKAMSFVADREGFCLPPVQLTSHNEIPLASGLGSSGAAIVAGMKLAIALGGHQLSVEKFLRYATELEGHADNVAAALLGGWVVHCINDDRSVPALKKDWPCDLKIIVITPDYPLPTKRARALLPEMVSRADAVYNMQRLALFNAAVENRAYGLVWEAMADRLHQPYRRGLVPGLSQALATQQCDGLLGIALSGAGPSVIALAHDQESVIADLIAKCFHEAGIQTTTRHLGVDNRGATIR